MDVSALAPWRDVAVVILVIEAAVMVAIPGIAIFFAARGMYLLNRWLRPQFKTVQMWAERIAQGTTRASDAVAEVPITMHSTVARVTVTTRGILRFMLGR